MSKNKTIKFLDYIIERDEDGLFVLLKPTGKPYENNLGCALTVNRLKKVALIFFMIARPEEFANEVYSMTQGIYTPNSYNHFISICEAENIKVPEEIGCTDDEYCVLTFKGKMFGKKR